MTCYETWSVILTALSFIATTAMVFLTWRTLCHNSRQLKFIIAQNTPKITGKLERMNNECVIVLFNTSQTSVSDVEIKVVYEGSESIPAIVALLEQANQYHYSFTPSDVQRIKTGMTCPTGVQVQYSGVFHIVARHSGAVIGDEHLYVKQLNVIL